MTEKKTDGFEIDLQKLLLAYLQKWWLILLAAVVVAGGAYAYTYYCVTPLYRASTTIYVNNNVAGMKVDTLTSSNLTASQQLVSTYINIVKSDRVVDKVVAELDGKYTPDDIREFVTASQVGETEIFAVYATTADPQEAANIANAVAAVAPREISDLIEGSSARMIDQAKVPNQRYSPSFSKNTGLGGIIGAVIAAAYVTLIFIFDVRIKDEEDLNDLSDLPILGQIPDFSTAAKGPDYGYAKEAAKSGTQGAPETRKKGGGKK